MFGEILLIIDHADSRDGFSAAEQALIERHVAGSQSGRNCGVFLRARDLSAHGGIWRAALGKTENLGTTVGCSFVGLEALTYLVLTCTLIYLEHAPELEWQLTNYIE